MVVYSHLGLEENPN